MLLPETFDIICTFALRMQDNSLIKHCLDYVKSVIHEFLPESWDAWFQQLPQALQSFLNEDKEEIPEVKRRRLRNAILLMMMMMMMMIKSHTDACALCVNTRAIN